MSEVPLSEKFKGLLSEKLIALGMAASAAENIAQKIAPVRKKDALVIANYNGDTSFLYQTKRSGWASYQYDLEEMIKLGANYLVIANPVQSDSNFAKKYEIVESTPQYILFNLNKQK
jgi:thymidylate kinase